MATAGSTAGGGGAEPRFVVPFLRNPGFVGREEDLAEAHALLQKREPVGVRPVAAAGMGGIGKTQLAVEYAYRHRDDYPGGVYWVNAARDVQGEMAALAEKVGLFEDGAAESERQRRRVLALVRFLDERPEALVIFDNVEDPRSLRNETFGLVPAMIGCRVLFTTRRREGGFGSPRGSSPCSGSTSTRSLRSRRLDRCLHRHPKELQKTEAREFRAPGLPLRPFGRLSSQTAQGCFVLMHRSSGFGGAFSALVAAEGRSHGESC